MIFISCSLKMHIILYTYIDLCSFAICIFVFQFRRSTDRFSCRNENNNNRTGNHYNRKERKKKRKNNKKECQTDLEVENEMPQNVTETLHTHTLIVHGTKTIRRNRMKYAKVRNESKRTVRERESRREIEVKMCCIMKRIFFRTF